LKKATTLDEQIEKYKNRNCELDISEIEIKSILLRIGYYRLGFYSFPFEETYPIIENRTHLYKQGTKFSEIVALQKFDVDLRMVLLKYINHIEICFRTKLVYFISNHYKGNPVWFIDNSVMGKRYIENFDEKIYNQLKNNQNVIKLHHKKYINDKYAPAWKTFEYATFGNVLETYKALQDKLLKEKIAIECGINVPQNRAIFTSYISAVKKIRDVSAHGGVLFDYSLDKALIKGPALEFESDNRSKLYPIILVMQYFLKHISEELAENMKTDIKNVFDTLKYNEKLKNIVENCSGYSYKKQDPIS